MREEVSNVLARGKRGNESRPYRSRGSSNSTVDFNGNATNELVHSRCATRQPTESEWATNLRLQRQFRSQTERPDSEWHRLLQEAIMIKVHFVVVSSTSGEGSVSDETLNEQIEVLNEAFLPQFQFQIFSTDRVVDDTFFECRTSGANLKAAYRRGGPELLNIYTCNGGGTLGWATLPFSGVMLKSDGVVIDYNTLPGGSKQRYNLGKVRCCSLWGI
jgi:hypothetical protein